VEKQNIECPNCQHSFHVEDVLNKELEIKFRKEFEKKIAVQKKIDDEKLEAFRLKEEAFEAKKDIARKEYAQKLEKDRLSIIEEERKKASENIRKDFEVELENFKKQAEEKNEISIQLQHLKNTLVEKEQDLKNVQELAKLEAKKELLEKTKEIEAKAYEKAKLENEVKSKEDAVTNEMKTKELEHQLAQQNKIIEDLKRKKDQGSMQLQGEVQELAIEAYLTNKFPFDTIEEIKKGSKGADCIQHINTREMQNCGKIYYESKRTQNFSNDWIDKFKADMRTKNIDIGVLVTQTMPKDMPRMGIKNGVWVCTFEEFKALSFVLRINCIKMANKLASQDNKGGKMEMLYNYLTSSEFKMQIEAIVEGFQTMKNDLDVEKRSMQRIWKSREKQLEKVILNTTEFYGSVQGIAGSSNIPKIDALSLDSSDLDA